MHVIFGQFYTRDYFQFYFVHISIVVRPFVYLFFFAPRFNSLIRFLLSAALCCGFACLTASFQMYRPQLSVSQMSFLVLSLLFLQILFCNIFFTSLTQTRFSLVCAFVVFFIVHFVFTLANLFYEGGMHRACGNSSGAQDCPTNYVCLQGNNLNPNYGITSFDTAFRSFFVVFRLIQRDFWEETMQYLTATAGPWHILLFIALIYYVSFQLCTLLWTSIALSYNYLKDEQWENDLLNDLNEVSALRIELCCEFSLLFFFAFFLFLLLSLFVRSVCRFS